MNQAVWLKSNSLPLTLLNVTKSFESLRSATIIRVLLKDPGRIWMRDKQGGINLPVIATLDITIMSHSAEICVRTSK